MCQILSGHGCARQLNHGADCHTRQVNVLVLGHRCDNLFSRFADQLKFTLGCDQRNHDLRMRVQPACNKFGGSFAQCADLQFEQAWQINAQADATQTQHRVVLMHTAHGGQHLLISWINRLALGLGHGKLDFHAGQIRQELMQRRVNQTHRHRLVIHNLEHLEEVLLLQFLQLIERILTILRSGFR